MGDLWTTDFPGHGLGALVSNWDTVSPETNKCKAESGGLAVFFIY